jgi:hypothetical protein
MAHIVWSQDELSVVREGIRLGWGLDEYCVRLPGRTQRAIQCKVSMLGASRPAGNKAIDAIQSASIALRERTLEAVQRFANDNHTTFEDALKLLYGAPPRPRTPGSEVIHKSCSITRQVHAVNSACQAA